MVLQQMRAAAVAMQPLEQQLAAYQQLPAVYLYIYVCVFVCVCGGHACVCVDGVCMVACTWD